MGIAATANTENQYVLDGSVLLLTDHMLEYIGKNSLCYKELSSDNQLQTQSKYLSWDLLDPDFYPRLDTILNKYPPHYHISKY